MKIIFQILFFLLFYSPFLNSQFTISGYVKAKESKEHLINAVIFNPLTHQSVLTNEYGFYSIVINDSIFQITASYVGFQPLTKEINLTKDTTINFLLSSISLNEIEVIAENNSIQNYQLGRNTIPIEKLEKVPSLLGEPDILRSLSILSGVSLGNEGNSNIFVRGGTPDQNLILLDDIPIYNATHLFSFFSVFNSDALNKVDLIKGGFPARYGGRLSSIIDVNMREGNKKELKGSLGIGLLTSSLMIESPIKKQKSSFLISTRASYLGLVNLFRKKENQEDYLDYWLYDINAKVNFLLPKGKLIFNFYHGNDFEIVASNRASSISGNQILENKKSDDKINWGNTILSTKYNTAISSKSYLTITGGYTRYGFNTKSKTEEEIYGDLDTLIRINNSQQESKLSDFIIKGEVNYTPNTKHQFRLGTSLIVHSFNYKDKSVNSIGSNNAESLLRNYEAIGYAENATRWNKLFTTNIGLHWNGYFTQGESFYSLQPRLSSKYQISKSISLQLGYAVMQQNLHLLTNSGYSFPSDTWIPSTKNVAPAKSNQIDLGLFFNIKNIFYFSIEAFHKKQRGLIEIKNNEIDIIENIEKWESLIEQDGIGKVKGVELMIQKNIGRWQGLLSYTLSKNERQFENLNFGKSYLFNYHRPHDFNINVFVTLNSKWSISTNWIYQTGRRVTLPIGLLPNVGVNSGSNLIFGEKNNGKFPDYHRLDIGLIYKRKKKNEREVQWTFNIYNLYNRQNTNFFSFSGRPVLDDQQNYLFSARNSESVSLFSIIPSLSYKYTF